MRKLNLTDTILDKLGFSEYWDENGTWGGRTLTFKNGVKFRIIDQKEMDDDTEGYGNGMYIAQHFYFAGWFAWEKIDGGHDLFFLHEMYECIEKYYPTCLEEFVDICKNLKMKIYIDDFHRTNICKRMDDAGYKIWNTESIIIGITHWMQLPSKPACS